VREFVPIQSQIGHAVVTERFKLCRYFQGEPREQLFDLQEEPGEMRSVADDNAFPEERAKLAAYYQQAGLA
jgi:arylsulfatase A-like enzyme